MKKDELTEIKSEIKSLRRKIKINILRSDTESVEENFYAIMDGYDRMRKHLNNSVTQCVDLCSEVKVVE